MLDALAREIARKDLMEYAKYAYPDFHENWHHGVIYHILNEVAHYRQKHVILQAPPRHGKTMSAGLNLPAFTMCTRPGTRVLYTTFAQKQGEEVVFDIKRLLRSDEHKALFPDIRIEGRDTTTAFKLNNGSSFTMRGVGQGIGGQPANLLICDDLVKGRAIADSPTSLDKLWEWYVGEATARLEWPYAVVLMFTRWAMDDPIGRVLELPDADKWKVLRFPAIMDESAKPPYDPRAMGEPLWIGRLATPKERETLPREELMKRDLDLLYGQKAASPFAWDSVYQQRPMPLEGQLFQDSWLKTYSNEPARVAAECQEVMISVDATFGRSRSSDYVAMLVAGRRGADIFVLDEVHKRMDYPETRAKIIELKEKWPQASILIEAKANGQALIDELKSEVPGIIPFHPGKTSKEARAQVAAARCEAGNVHIPRNYYASWIDDWRQDIVGFGSRPHDDRVDALSQLCVRWQGFKAASSHLRRIMGLKEGARIPLNGLFTPR